MRRKGAYKQGCLFKIGLARVHAYESLGPSGNKEEGRRHFMKEDNKCRKNPSKKSKGSQRPKMVSITHYGKKKHQIDALFF